MKKLLFLCLLFPSLCFSSSWECVSRVITCHTWRMKVPQGWIVSGDNSAGGGEEGYAMIFLPDEKHEWEIK